MVSLDLLQNALKNPVAPDSGKDSVSEEHFDKIVTCIEQEKMSQAVGMIETNFSKGIPDVRLIVYYYYAHFFNQGIKSFIDVFPSIISIVNDHWETLRPLSRKEKHVENSLNWLFSQTINKLKYCEKLLKTGKKHPIWEKSVNGISEDEIDKLLQASTEFKNFFFEKWPKSPTKERVIHLIKKIEDFNSIINENKRELEQEEEAEEEPEHSFQEEVIPEPVKVEEPVEPSPVEEEELPEEGPQEEPLEASISEEMQAAPTEDPVPEEPTPQVNVQPEVKPTSEAFSLEKMEIFINKLKLFERLIGKNDYVKAALVAKDIDYLIENFDPLIFFPKLFSNYFSLLAKHVAALSEQWGNKESLQLKYLEKLYHTDLDKFIEW